MNGSNEMSRLKFSYEVLEKSYYNISEIVFCMDSQGLEDDSLSILLYINSYYSTVRSHMSAIAEQYWHLTF